MELKAVIYNNVKSLSQMLCMCHKLGTKKDLSTLEVFKLWTLSSDPLPLNKKV